MFQGKKLADVEAREEESKEEDAEEEWGYVTEEDEAENARLRNKNNKQVKPISILICKCSTP